MKKRFVLLMTVFVLIVGLSGCSTDKFTGCSEKSTSCGNIVMGQGKFAYSNGFIYFADGQCIYEYEIESNKTIALYPEVTPIDGLFVDGNYIYFSGDGLARVTKDGEKTEKIKIIEGGFINLYVENQNAYYLNTKGGTFFVKNLSDNTERKLLDGVLTYHIDEHSIYAAVQQGEKYTLYKADKETLDFADIGIEKGSIAVFTTNNFVLSAEPGSYQLTKLNANGGKEALPVYSTYFQTVDNTLFYSDSRTFKDGCFELKSYEFASGEESSVCNDVYDFCILNERYIAMQCIGEQGIAFRLYDRFSEKLCEMNYK